MLSVFIGPGFDSELVFAAATATNSSSATLYPSVYRKSKAAMMTSLSPIISSVDSPTNQLLPSDSLANQTSGIFHN